MDNQNIKSTFSPKSDLALAEMMKKYNLGGSPVEFSLEKITMFFSRAEISEKEMINSIQKEVGVSQKIAGQIATEIKNTLIPTLWNNLSEKEKESLLHVKKEVAEETEEIVPEKILTIEPEIPEPVPEPKAELNFKPSTAPAPQKKPGRPKKFFYNTDNTPDLQPKKPAEEKPKRSGPDNYREPVE
ncbi:MAG: hypothetical protein Q8Q48_01870 [Candidatus Staskawiczbacteria bacterium]|nr:hypothetical protein [Candidatus Staskawiczbacteria bacterium]